MSTRLIWMVCLLFVFTFSVFSQNTLDKAGLTAANPAAVAYSVRKLSSTYAGSALQVRRSSDNTRLNIGFTANGDLDTSALLTFVGAGNGFVTAWYDQSGNGKNLTQGTTTHQPQLVASGVIEREDGLPFIRFFGTPGVATYDELALAVGMTTVGHVTAVMYMPTTGDGFILSNTSAYYWHSRTPSVLVNSTFASASVQGGSGWYNGASHAPTSVPWPSSLSIEELEPSIPGTNTGWNNIGTDRFTAHNMSKGGGYSELILFTAALPATARQSLEINEASYFTGIALPLTWQSFTAQVEGPDVRLNWQTASEENTRDFVVQRSTDGSNFTDLASMPAAGTSVGERSYGYTDMNPLPGADYYRIAETDLDGVSHYSEVRLVDIAPGSAGEPFVVEGNPPGGGLLRVTVNRTMVLSLYSLDGRLLWKGQCAAGMQNIDVSSLARGIYLLSGERTVVKVVVE